MEASFERLRGRKKADGTEKIKDHLKQLRERGDLAKKRENGFEKTHGKTPYGPANITGPV